MNNEYSVKQSRRTRHFLSGIMVVFLFLLVWRVSAQSENDDDWVDPLNLSLSGTAVQPSMAIAPSGEVHLFWQDRLVGYQYTYSNGRDWQPPVKVLVPFTDPPLSPVVGVDDFGGFYKPELIIDQNNRLHAFWSGDEQRLRYSRTALLENGEVGEWAPIYRLSEDVSGISVVVGPDNTLHLAYIQPSLDAETPAGVYYRYSADGGDSWAEPQLIYQSDYLRSVDAENVNIKTAVNADGQIFVVWDDPLIETVFESHTSNLVSNESSLLDESSAEDVTSSSSIEEVSWSIPMIVDQRLLDDETVSPGPENINVVAKGDEIHLAWQGGHDQQQCVIYHQISLDGGQSWAPAQKALDTESQECSNLTRLFFGEDELLFLLTKVILHSTKITQIFLQAWDGEQWSEAVLQEPLVSFINPQTFRQVDFGCHQPQLTPDNHLFVIGCGDADVWGAKRSLGDTSMWVWPIAPSSEWSDPDLLTTRDAPVQSPTMFVDSNGSIHVFWNEPVVETGNQAIYYMVKERNEWSWPVPVLLSPKGDLQQESITLDSLHNRFLATWIDSLDKNLYFSQVSVDDSAFVTDWSIPISLPIVDSLNEWPQVLVDMAGNILVIYEVPVNEDRGVFMTRSEDGGNTWEDPVQLFDGVAANWSVVGKPVLSISDDGVYNLLLKRPFSLSDSNNDLFYLRSEDAGKTWTDPIQINDQLSDWAQLVADNPDILHVVYQEHANNEVITRHTFSKDNGMTWVSPILINNYETDEVPTSLMSDADGNLHIVFSADDTLQYRRWNGTRWLIGEDKKVDDNMSTTIALDGHVGSSMLDLIYVNIYQQDTPLEENENDEQPNAGALSPLSYELNRLTYSLSNAQPQMEVEVVEQKPQMAEPTAVPETLSTAVPEQPNPNILSTAVISTTTVPNTTVSFQEQPATNSYNGAFVWIISIGIVLLLILIVSLIIFVRMRFEQR